MCDTSTAFCRDTSKSTTNLSSFTTLSCTVSPTLSLKEVSSGRVIQTALGLVNGLSLSRRLPAFPEDLPSDAAGLHVGDLVRNLFLYRLPAFSMVVQDVSLR